MRLKRTTFVAASVLAGALAGLLWFASRPASPLRRAPSDLARPLSRQAAAKPRPTLGRLPALAAAPAPAGKACT